MDIIKEFMGRYRREYDFYEQAAKLVHGRIDTALVENGIRAIATYRAKRPNALEAKIRHRNKVKNYASIEDVYRDIVDLSGVRIALYFPGDRVKVDKIIENSFSVPETPKVFPERESPRQFESRVFSGYWATHYRVYLMEDNLAEGQFRYTEACVEIQVASVLMHAWSEVEHDLVYKPLSGKLSEDELAILDELNGMVLAGEIALRRLQKAMEVRVSENSSPFENHYELASFLVHETKSHASVAVDDSSLGRTDLLFEFLKKISLNSSRSVKQYLVDIDAKDDKRPICNQVIDKIIADQPERSLIYLELQGKYGVEDSARPNQGGHFEQRDRQVGEFVRNWAKLEDAVERIWYSEPLEPNTRMTKSSPVYRAVIGGQADKILSASTISRLRKFQSTRNQIVHGRYEVKSEALQQANNELLQLIVEVEQEVKSSSKRARKTKQ